MAIEAFAKLVLTIDEFMAKSNSELATLLDTRTVVLDCKTGDDLDVAYTIIMRLRRPGLIARMKGGPDA